MSNLLFHHFAGSLRNTIYPFGYASIRFAGIQKFSAKIGPLRMCAPCGPRSAQRYSVRLLALGAQTTPGGGLATTATVVGDHRVRGTYLRIPRGVLATGTSYVAVVTAT